ncbi:hypothetical protein [Nostoc sp.]
MINAKNNEQLAITNPKSVLESSERVAQPFQVRERRKPTLRLSAKSEIQN